MQGFSFKYIEMFSQVSASQVSLETFRDNCRREKMIFTKANIK